MSPPDCGGKSVGSDWDRQWRTAGSSLQATGLSAWRLQELSERQSHEHTVSQARSVLKYRSSGPYVMECTGRLWVPPYIDSSPLWGPSVAP